MTCLRYMIGLPQNKNNLVGSRPLEEIFYLLQRGFSLNVTHPVALILVSYHSGTLTYVKRNYQYWWYNLLVVIWVVVVVMVIVMVIWWLWLSWCDGYGYDCDYHYGVGTVQSMLANTCLKRKQWLIREQGWLACDIWLDYPKIRTIWSVQDPLKEIFYLPVCSRPQSPVGITKGVLSKCNSSRSFDIGFISFWDPYLCQEELPVLMV